MARELSEGHEWLYTSCSCVAYLKARGYNLPSIKSPDDLDPNTTPHKGAIALFKYKNGVPHMAEVIAVNTTTFTVREANYSKCARGERVVSFYDPSLRGFYASNSP